MERRLHNYKDLSGHVFGRLTVVARVGKTVSGHVLWSCRCDCGRDARTTSNKLTTGRAVSCGRHKADRARILFTRHGLIGTPEYLVWQGMRARCTNQKHRSYKNYGGRGISVSKEWDSFARFYQDVGPRPTQRHTIERVNNNLGYCRDNCKWATRKEQRANCRPSLRPEPHG